MTTILAPVCALLGILYLLERRESARLRLRIELDHRMVAPLLWELENRREAMGANNTIVREIERMGR